MRLAREVVAKHTGTSEYGSTYSTAISDSMMAFEKVTTYPCTSILRQFSLRRASSKVWQRDFRTATLKPHYQVVYVAKAVL